MSNYWTKRITEQKKLLAGKSIAETEKELATLYKKALRDNEKELKALLYDLQKNGEDRIIDIYKYNRYWEVRADINNRLRDLGIKESKILDKQFTDMYFKVQDYFNRNPKFFAKSVGSNRVDKITEKSMRPVNLKDPILSERANVVVNSVWCADGKNWSDRVWTHIDQLSQDLEQGLTDIIARGDNPENTVKYLQEKYGVSYRQSQMVVRTELSHIYNQASIDRYSEAGIDMFEWLTSGDEARMCEDCADMNGKTFRLEEAIEGENCPPLHPSCLCTIVPVISGGE